MLTRSTLAIMVELAGQVRVPAEHVRDGCTPASLADTGGLLDGTGMKDLEGEVAVFDELPTHYPDRFFIFRFVEAFAQIESIIRRFFRRK